MSRAKKKFQTPAECPVCGADVPTNAQACPECGADERTGWDEEATRYDGLDLPDENDSDELAGERASRKSGGVRARVIAWTSVVLVIVLVIYLVGIR